MTTRNIFSSKSVASKEEHWIPLADLMTGLMMMFMLIALTFMMKVEKESEKVRDVAKIYEGMRAELYADLQNEFKGDLQRWGAEIDKDLTFRFNEPSVLFDTGKSSLKNEFMRILDDFFPRYVKIISSPKYIEFIEEIRVEGHTSSMWGGASNFSDAYFLNMELSQSRTRVTLQYLLSINRVMSQEIWLISRLTANGLSFSRRKYMPDGTEDQIGSQRVEFRLRTNAEHRLSEILSISRK